MNISRTRQDVKKLKAFWWFIFNLSLIEIKGRWMIFSWYCLVKPCYHHDTSISPCITLKGNYKEMKSTLLHKTSIKTYYKDKHKHIQQ